MSYKTSLMEKKHGESKNSTKLKDICISNMKDISFRELLLEDNTVCRVLLK